MGRWKPVEDDAHVRQEPKGNLGDPIFRAYLHLSMQVQSGEMEPSMAVRALIELADKKDLPRPTVGRFVQTLHDMAPPTDVRPLPITVSR